MNKFITMIVSVVVVVVLISAILIPVVDQAHDTFTTRETVVFNNTGDEVTLGSQDEEYTVDWDSALPGTIKVNGNTPTVYFVAGEDATVSPTQKDVVEGLTYGELPLPTRTGYTFDGWYDSTEYTTEITDTSIVVGTEDKILYAKWIANTYTVTFDADGGTVSPATKTVTFGSAYGELPVPTYTGHIFGGWFDEDNNPIVAQSIVSIADDHTLTAVWTLEQYLVSFTTDGNGTVDVAEVLVDYGTSYTISSNTITIDGTTITATADEGYVFSYWEPSTDGTVIGAMTFIAHFQISNVTLSFITDGTTGATVSQASIADVPIGSTYVVADNVVTVTNGTTLGTVTASLVDGYYFVGWSEPQGMGTVSSAMTFEAQYEVIEIAQVVCSQATTWVVTTDGKLFGCGSNNFGQQGSNTSGSGTGVLVFTQRLSTETIARVFCSDDTTWVVTTDGKLFGCGRNNAGQQGDNSTSDVLVFTQRGPPGSINIPVQLSPQNLTPIHLDPLSPITPHINPLNPVPMQFIDYTAITGFDTWQMGGEDWMLATVTVGVDQYALALYYAGLTEPLVWDEDVHMVFDNGTLTVENGGNTYTMTYSSIYYRSSGGSYRLLNGSATVLDDTPILAYGVPTDDSGALAKGTVGNLTAVSIADGQITLDGATATYSDVEGFDTAKTLTGVSFQYDDNGTSPAIAVIVPSSVSVTHLTENKMLTTILDAVPIILIIGTLMVLASALFMSKRY